MLTNRKCVSRDPLLLPRAARFTTGYVRLVGQEPAPRKRVLMKYVQSHTKGKAELGCDG